MDVTVAPGTYVVAVSGGVDSMALLDLLVKQVHSPQSTACLPVGKVHSNKRKEYSGSQLPAKSLKLIVAHFDHGIRDDSKQDRLHVQQAAKHHGLPFIYDEAHLGPGTSEAEARKTRYAFLHGARKAAGAIAVITAHHQDDVLETAIINLLRGTNRRGLSALKSHPNLHRPLLHMPKNELIAYAQLHGVKWREDSTNQDTTHLRNYVRHRIVSRFSDLERIKFLAHLGVLGTLNRQIDEVLINELHQQPHTHALDRHWFIMLPHTVAREVLATWLRQRGVSNVDKKRLELLVSSAKTLHSGKRVDIDLKCYLQITADQLALKHRERY